MYDGFSKFMEFSNMTHLIWWSFFASHIFCGDRSTLDGGGRTAFPLSLDAPKTRPFGADSSQPDSGFWHLLRSSGAFWEFGDMKDKGKGHDMKQGFATNWTYPPQNCEIYGGVPKHLLGVSTSFKNFNHILVIG